MRKKSMALAGFLVVALGCAGSRMATFRPLDTDLRPYSSFAFAVETKVTEDVTMEMTALEEQVILKVKELTLFQAVTLGEPEQPSEATLFVKAVISQIKKVSGSKRFFMGAFAGKASMTTDIFFIDAATGETLGAYSVTGESGGTGVSGGTNEAILKAAEGIAQIISEHSVQKSG
jgi:hypothetical protein